MVDALSSLCAYDSRHPDYELFFGHEDPKPSPSPGCSCDNCFYGRTELANEIMRLRTLMNSEHYEWELQDASGEWVAGGSADDQDAAQQEGFRYLTVYSQDGPHKLTIRRHQVHTIMEMQTNPTSDHLLHENSDTTN